MKPITKTVVITLFILAIIFFSTAGFIVFVGLSDNLGKSDVAIVLGSKVNADGTCSSRLAARLNKGVELYRQGLFKAFIVSGGSGKEGYDEANVMKNYLIKQGIPDAAILTDSDGYNTEMTAINSRAIMAQHQFKRALIISQYFHIARTKFAFNQCGLSPVYHAHANFYEWRDVYSTIREVLGYYDYLFFRNFCAS